MPGVIVTSAVQAFEAAVPGVTVAVLRTGWTDQVQVVRDGRADVSYVRLPVDRTGLRLLPVAAEPRVAVFAASHRLAGKEQVSIADLADELLIQHPDAVPEWRDIATGLAERSPSDGHEYRYSVEEKLEHVAAGRGLAVLPASVLDFYRRPDLASAVIADIGPSETALVWGAGRRSPLLRAFLAVATRIDAPAPARA
jgi:DNA-binding transcriptional LysR family regulator